MKELRFHDLAQRAEMDTQTCSSLYLVQGDVGLTEDVIKGYGETFIYRRAYQRLLYDTADELVAELDYFPPEDVYRLIVVRDAHRLFTSKSIESLLLRLERQKRNHRVRVILVGEEPSERAREWFLKYRAYGLITEPTFEKLGHWVATKTASRWDYRKLDGALITPDTGLKLAEHVGWDYTKVLQAAMTLQTFYDEQVQWMPWELVSALVPPQLGAGYADALVFGGGRRTAHTLAEGITRDQTLKTLGMIQYYLRQMAKLRAAEVETMSDRMASEATGIHIWHYRTKYKPVYATYTNDRIRMRSAAVAEARRNANRHGVLNVLAAEW